MTFLRKLLSCRRRMPWILSGAMVTAAAHQGCMLAPNDGTILDPGKPIDFNGYHLTKSGDVRISGWNVVTGVSDLVASTTASNESDISYGSTPLYAWSTTQSLSGDYWLPGVHGAYARVRADDGAGHNLVSTTADWWNCYNAHSSNVTDFALYCSAPNSPFAFLYTSDYACSDFGLAGGVLNHCCVQDPALTQLTGGLCEGQMTGGFKGATGSPVSETSLAFVPAWTDKDSGVAYPAHLVVGYNDPQGGLEFLGWAFSTDGGATWTARNRNQPGPNAVVLASGQQQQAVFRGDPSIVSVGGDRGGLVAYAMLGETTTGMTNDNVDMVVVTVSRDGGETFTTTTQVNDVVGTGFADQPSITVDPADNTVWVVWRTLYSGTYGLWADWVRGGRIDSSTGAIQWIDGGHQAVAGLFGYYPDWGFPRIQVFSEPGLSRHSVAVSYAANLSDTDPANPCPDGGTHPFGFGFNFIVSHGTDGEVFDEGQDVLLGHPDSPGCVGGTASGGAIIEANNRVDFVIDRKNSTYLAVRMVGTKDAAGHLTGSQIEVYRRALAEGSLWNTVLQVPRTGPTDAWQFNPQITADDDGHVAVSYYESAGTTSSISMNAIGSLVGGDPGTWSAPVRLSTSAIPASGRSIGDYNSIVARPASAAAPQGGPIPAPAMPPASPGDSGWRFQGWPANFYTAGADGSGKMQIMGYGVPQ